MPDNPSSWISFFSKLSPEAAGVGMAMFIATLRVIYDREETAPLRIVLEALICGALSLTTSFGLIALELNANWAIFAGGVIGYMGSASVRVLALKFLNRKVGK